ncbi:MAG: hypothetical protein QXD15_03625, partial [Thermoplasmata archaeon]
MHVNVRKYVYKGRTYFAVRIFKTVYINGKKTNKIVKTIGNTTDIGEVERLQRKAWEYIYQMEKDIPLSLRE